MLAYSSAYVSKRQHTYAYVNIATGLLLAYNSVVEQRECQCVAPSLCLSSRYATRVATPQRGPRSGILSAVALVH